MGHEYKDKRAYVDI